MKEIKLKSLYSIIMYVHVIIFNYNKNKYLKQRNVS